MGGCSPHKDPLFSPIWSPAQQETSSLIDLQPESGHIDSHPRWAARDQAGSFLIQAHFEQQRPFCGLGWGSPGVDGKVNAPSKDCDFNLKEWYKIFLLVNAGMQLLHSMLCIPVLNQEPYDVRPLQENKSQVKEVINSNIKMNGFLLRK